MDIQFAHIRAQRSGPPDRSIEVPRFVASVTIPPTRGSWVGDESPATARKLTASRSALVETPSRRRVECFPDYR